MSANVVAIHGNGNAIAGKPEQTVLFRDPAAYRGQASILDVSTGLDHLPSVLVRSGVSGILDFRRIQKLGSSVKQHVAVCDHIETAHIGYVYMYELTKVHTKKKNTLSWQMQIMLAKADELFNRGLVICLVDASESATDFGCIVRRLLERLPGFRAEIHPRALIGE